MSTIQLTLVRIDNCGPRTVAPEPRREMDLQTLQSRLFVDIAQFTGSRDDCVFFTRFDNIVAAADGIDRAAHGTPKGSVRNRYPVTISLGVGVSGSPIDALEAATDEIRAVGSAPDEDRTEVLTGEFPPAERQRPITVAHFGLKDATGTYTDRLNEFDSVIETEWGCVSLVEYMRRPHGALPFFSGDSIVAICPESSAADCRGVGRGDTTHEAGFAANTHSKSAGTTARPSSSASERSPPVVAE